MTTGNYTIHLFTHTHWDRDWFLSAEFINEWLPELYENLFALIEKTPEYRFICDGRTIMIVDYLEKHPEALDKIKQYAQAGNLLAGPSYAQIDWRTVSEESLMRNMYIGIQDAQGFGNVMKAGWLLDNFGHCSQSPQVHHLFGIDQIYVWRGPGFETDDFAADFIWEGSDDTALNAHYLVSGYRNFYNVQDTQAYTEQRIQQVQEMLAPFAPHNHLVFLDGYDTDVWPEDPLQLLEGAGAGDTFIRSTPEKYAQITDELLDPASKQRIKGELYSGKYACIFPGSLSARSYLRLENALVERVLSYYLDPVLLIARQAGLDVDIKANQECWRSLIGTQEHDPLGGVCVDQVHDQTEIIYQQVYAQASDTLTNYLQYIPSILNLQKGTYAFFPSPFAYENLTLDGGDRLYQLNARGTGFYRVKEESIPSTESSTIDAFTWENAFYTLTIAGGQVALNGQPVGGLTLEKDIGDTYTADTELFVPSPEARVTSLKLLYRSEQGAKIALQREIRQDDIYIQTEEELFCSDSPVVNWALMATTQGAGYRLRFTYDTANRDASVFAKMPFDIYERPRRDTNYFGAEVPESLRPVLLAAREIGSVSDFPFQGFVALSDGSRTQSVLAKGLREYEVDGNGRISITLKRSVEWLAKPKLRTRLGDAGPYMYVPGARDERTTHFEVGLIDVNADVHNTAFLKWFYLFEYGFYIFENQAFAGAESKAILWDEPIPWSGIQNLANGKSLLHVYNPDTDAFTFDTFQTVTNPFGEEAHRVDTLGSRKIASILLDPLSAIGGETAVQSAVAITVFPGWPVGEERSTIEESTLAELREKAEEIKSEIARVSERLDNLPPEGGLPYHQAKHKHISLQRERLEIELSLALNEYKRLGNPENLKDEIREVGRELNWLRRQRRTYDYILSIFEN